jgi:hypothetical protein
MSRPDVKRPPGRGAAVSGTTQADTARNVPRQRESAQAFTPAQRRALFLRRCGVPWSMVWVCHYYAKRWPGRHIDGGLQRMLARSLHADGQR